MSKAMRTVFFALFACVLTQAAAICGNNVFAQGEGPEKKAVVATFGGPGIGAIGGFGIGLVGGPVVGAIKNAPFSGEMVCEYVQTLADGNRISHQTNTIIYRDGGGRIRRETSVKIWDANSGAYKEHTTIQVSDHFGGQNFMLDPQNRTARKFPVRPISEIAGVTTLQAATVGGIADRTAIPPVSVAVPSLIRPVGRFGVNGETKNESLGSQMIEGVEAEGTRITHTIPAGSMGNERPIEATYERWYSKELQLDVLIKSVDPRSGESTQQMTKINLGEPDPALFEIPSDYTVQELMGRSAVMNGIGPDEAATANLLREKMRNPTAGLDDRSTPKPMSASLKPTILYKVKASYTEAARRNRIEGEVVLNVVFAANGAINSIRVVRGLPDGLTEKAIEAALKTRFQPAVENGTPVSVRGDLSFTFVIDK
jgi:TonB family protein